MTRVRRGYIAQRRRTKMGSFASNFRGAHSRLSRAMVQQKRRSLVSAHRDRKRQKRDFRRLWITRINAAIREIFVYYNLYYNYSQYIHELYKNRLILNRKILAQITIFNRNCFSMISNEIMKLVRIPLK
uniref:50S ribosomal protein L20 n=2 Tax=Drosera TaxID=4363 RepID=A0A1Z1GBF0_9CARY|nr:ribosomal protein L20 [Drosera erythrorhiza]YP_009390954.1 ribosomal protein L20 [Drosera erythrorhiza]ARV87546.1 ribosomal protein L20 [Drosera erythrorhiza]ARV87559.1 ribosomal protein L20 [Drosera erythrorhiza]QWZ47354.1 ribosomal protein L20 [Drosera peltata]